MIKSFFIFITVDYCIIIRINTYYLVKNINKMNGLEKK